MPLRSLIPSPKGILGVRCGRIEGPPGYGEETLAEFGLSYNLSGWTNYEAWGTNTLDFRRTDRTRNMCGFYRLDVQPDLFGGALLAKDWGYIGVQGRAIAERYNSEIVAAAMQQQTERKEGAATDDSATTPPCL
jgi:predicted DNA-binding WGR domain protein